MAVRLRARGHPHPVSRGRAAPFGYHPAGSCADGCRSPQWRIGVSRANPYTGLRQQDPGPRADPKRWHTTTSTNPNSSSWSMRPTARSATLSKAHAMRAGRPASRVLAADLQRRGELLLQQRAAGKRLWPLYWSNSCCSHPRRAETHGGGHPSAPVRGARHALPAAVSVQVPVPGAIRRRRAPSTSCARCSSAAATNRCEVDPRRDRGLALGRPRRRCRRKWPARRPEQFTPWFMLEWARIWRDHRAAVLALDI